MDKEYILSEIKRTAKENGGKSLGIQKFFNETGIKKTDWFGKYWARWGDAVLEAGLTPNQLQTSYDEDWLIEKFINLISELKKFPASGDLRIKSIVHLIPVKGVLN